MQRITGNIRLGFPIFSAVLGSQNRAALADNDNFIALKCRYRADVILPLLPLLVKKARKKLVLSGILKEQESLITEKLRELQILDFKIQADGEWISVLMENG